MHFIITDASLARSRAIHLSGTKLVLALVGLSLVMMLLAAGLYHYVFLKGARERWPVVGALVRLVVADEFEQRDRFMRENLDAMARRLGDMQAKMLQLEALRDRVSGLAGINPNDLKVAGSGRGGALVEGHAMSMQELQKTLDDLEKLTGEHQDLLTVMESRLIDQRLKTMMLPTQHPVNGPLGSPFGWRIDPFNGHSALHTGLDFQAVVGTPIQAAAGGVVVAAEVHHEYGNMIEIDHGNNLITRYAHASKLLVKKGDLVRRGQNIALVGTTGRSTGPHLHFEVLVQGVPQDPMKFLNAGRNAAPAAVAALATDVAAPRAVH
ncbi:M23 family metallopeptidase [Ramlibacter sp. G-1-2-2]|uniref:M23 family metallopeptidase n=1 Tax=Ramlibacter agri TaxID=2728837 RepID=A0A848HE43_9BURK|nr:M23 family metallopeptidase [Ramlibacter agri]NML47750.1 M23 family metallopeptidase [Ramlibacter agri]